MESLDDVDVQATEDVVGVIVRVFKPELTIVPARVLLPQVPTGHGVDADVGRAVLGAL